MRTSRLRLSLPASVVVLLAVAFSAHAEDWPTTKFVLRSVDPTSDTPHFVGQLVGFSDEQEPVVAQYEQYLSEVAVYYQSLGFKAPNLPTTTFGEKAYIAYLYDYSDKDTTAKAGYWADGRIDLRVDISRAIVKISDQEPTLRAVDRTYEDLAHELFHNIQRSYQVAFELDHGTWIMEGQAQALGMEAAKRLRGIEVNKGGGTEDYWLGSRGYYRPLPTETHDENYRTASFWRYVGEHVAAAKANGRAGAARTVPDYRYLAKIYGRHPFLGPASAAGDLRWLDNALEKEVGLGLDRLYPNFAATFAAYVPYRLSKAPPSSQAAEDKWLNFVYELCPAVPLGTGTPTGSVSVALQANASRCFKADISGAGRFDVAIQVHANTASSLEALHIGVSGGTKVSSPIIVQSPAGGGYIGHWRFRIPTAAPQVFIVSNMAPKPSWSEKQDIVLNLTASQWDSSLTTPTPQAQPPSKPAQRSARPKSGTTASRDATREANQEDLASGLASLSNQTALGSRAFLNRNIDPCNQPFAILGCGPNTTIQLALTPGVLGDFSQTSGTGGMLGQFLSNLTAIADNGIAQTTEDLMAAQQAMSRIEGSEVTLVIPLIEYGFTGSFSNAHVSMSGANGDGGFQTGGSQGDHAGNVTIEEFTPFVLRGRFSAGLTRTTQADEIQVEHRNISGSFVVAAPWEGDRDVTYHRSGEDPTASATQDLNEVIPGLRSLGAASSQNPDAPAAGPASPVGPGAGPAVGFASCRCSCQPIESYEPACRPICAVAVQQCGAQATRQAALEQEQAEQAELGKLAGEVDRMRADLEAFLQDNNMAHLKDAMLENFDNQPTPEAKRFLLFTFGMPVDGYGK